MLLRASLAGLALVVLVLLIFKPLMSTPCAAGPACACELDCPPPPAPTPALAWSPAPAPAPECPPAPAPECPPAPESAQCEADVSAKQWRKRLANHIGGESDSCRDHPNLKRALLAITTCNHWDVTERLLKGLQANDEAAFYEPVLFDDHSTDGTVDKAAALGVRVETNTVPEGVTYTWNEAYRAFKHECWGYYFNVNNDIVVPRGAVPAMMRELDAHPEIGILGPMTTRAGIGKYSKYACPHQPVEVQFPELEPDVAALPESLQGMQDAVLAADKDIMETRVLGFFLACSRSSIKLETVPDHFWDPFTVNINQEQGFMRDHPNMMYLSRRAFVYHEKGTTVTQELREAGKMNNVAAMHEHD